MQKKKSQRGFHLVVVLVVVVVVGVIGFVGFKVVRGSHDKQDKKASYGVGQYGDKSNAGQFSADAVERGKYLSYDQCSGEGSKKLGSGPMRPADIGVIEPMGLVAGGHVTPVDHQYYYGKDMHAAPSSYDVLAPADGTIVNVEVRPRAGDAKDYRVVISYSCTFFSYFDLANSLSPELAAKMPSGYQTKNGPQKVKIAVKQGEVLAKVGGQSLDFAVWDTTQILKGLLVSKAYTNYEPWKVATVEPLKFYTDDAKSALLPYYVRQAEPRDGKIDFDQDGTAAGGWFKQGTNGYIGAFKQTEFNPMTYAAGHFSLAPDFLNPADWALSIGGGSQGGAQYAIKSPSVAPDKLTQSSGLVKYELTQYAHIDETGGRWMAASVPKTIKLDTSSPTTATALVQLTGKRELKVEVFPGKTAAQVSSFSDPTIYDRGDNAKAMANQ